MRRFIIEDLNGRFLDLEFPLIVTELGSAHNGAATIKGTVEPDSGAAIPQFLPHQAWIHEENDGNITRSCLVTRCAFNGKVWEVEAFGFSTFLRGNPYTGAKRFIRTDPLDIVRELWSHAQREHDLGVTVVGKSRVTVGEPERDVQFTTSSGDTVEFEAGPFKLEWWDSPDMGDKFNELVRASEMDFLELSGWNEKRTAIWKRIEFFPQVGVKRRDLKFVQGDNVTETVAFVADGEAFCNRVLAIGAGEGAAALRVDVAAPDDRLPRCRVIEAKSVRSRTSLEALAREELERGQRAVRVEAFQVDGLHAFAPRSELRVGDWVTVEAVVPWLGRRTVEVRIMELSDDGRFVNIGV